MSEHEYFSDEQFENEYPTIQTVGDVQQRSQELVESIFKRNKYLHGILERQESEIRQLWDNKDFDKKRKVLFGAFDGMPTVHRQI